MPGRTAQATGALWKSLPAARWNNTASRSANGDLAYAVLFLASDESRLVNATDLVVDGALLSS